MKKFQKILKDWRTKTFGKKVQTVFNSDKEMEMEKNLKSWWNIDFDLSQEYIRK